MSLPYPAPDSVVNKLKRQRLHDISDSEDETTTEVKKTRCDDDKSDSHGRNKLLETVTADKQTNHSAPDGEQKQTHSKKVKCKYWEKCFRKNDAHLKKYRHPSDDIDDDDDDDDGVEEEAKTLGDGEAAEVNTGTRTYHIKRTADSYYCDCVGWKTQKKPASQRTCKHLRDYLGEEIENRRVGITGAKENKGGAALIFRPAKHKNISVLLAHKYSDDIDPTGWWISEKLDGVRAYWDGKSFFSRLGNEFIPPKWFTANFPENMHLDGELFGGRGKFQDTVSIVKNPGSLRWKELQYHVFDAPNLKSKPFEDRLKGIEDYFALNSCKTVVIVQHTKCQGRKHIDKMLKEVESLGGEGLMIRQARSLYECKRSNTLLKIKTFYDAEAVVIGHEQGKGRNASVTGALRCRMECGKEFSVGSGLSDVMRKNPPKIGSIITYKFQEYTNSGCPRFPTFAGVRVDVAEPKDAILPKGKQNNNEKY